MLTFGDRLGWEVYAPIGLEWFSEGYWNHEREWHGDSLARQYLAGIWYDPLARDGHVEQADHHHPGRILRGVTLEQARSQKWDVVLTTLQHNQEGFARFGREVGAKVGFHLGNIVLLTNDRWELADFALLSTTYPFPPPLPHLVYHQEFSLADFRYEWPPATQDVSSFVVCFAENKAEYAYWREMSKRIGGAWRAYGAYGSAPEDEYAAGNIETAPAIAKLMRETRVGWHAKHWSDGYGHVIHNWFAVGRPVIGYARYYAAQLAGPLWIEGETSFDIERRNDDEIAALITRLRSDDEYHREISANAAARFREIVDFEAEAQSIRKLMETVL